MSACIRDDLSNLILDLEGQRARQWVPDCTRNDMQRLAPEQLGRWDGYRDAIERLRATAAHVTCYCPTCGS